MNARAPAQDFDDSCPTLEIPSPFAPSSGVWPSQAPSPLHLPVAVAPVPGSLDPASSTLHDVVVPDAFTTWQNERLLAADASLAIRPSSAVPVPSSRVPGAPRPASRPRTSTAPLARFAFSQSPDISIAPVNVTANATLNPDGTLLPWRHERPPSRRGTLALALVFALVASAGATVGFMRSASQPVAVAARVARTPAIGIRHLLLVDSSETKRESAPAAAAPRPARRRVAARPAAPSAESVGDLGEGSAD